jgi:arylsulfatase A-like enzyme/Tfp pilus assembly protein PilF
MAKAKQQPPRRKPKWSPRVVVPVLVVAALVLGVLVYQRLPASSDDLSRLVDPGDADGYNVVLITLDTVRADRLGTYGYEAAETPNIDGLVEHGVRFDHAVSPVPVTLPSHASIMTGLYPPRHGVRDNGLFHLAPDRITLAERLKRHGYDTAAFIGCFVLDERFGLGQGFDTYDFEVTQDGFQPSNFDFNQRPAGAVTASAVDWLQARGGASAPYFLWVHYFDAHVPYTSLLGSLPQFAGRPYDAEIAYVDLQIGRLLAAIDRLGQRDRTLIVLVADHGEGLKEHGEATHGLFVYGSTIRVPFIFSNAVLFPGSHHVSDRAVSLVDVVPTLEALLGIEPAGSRDGVNLLSDGNDPDRALYLETKMAFHAARCSPLYGIQTRDAKYVHGPEPEAFDLAADPDELTNLFPDGAGDLPDRLARMRAGWAEVEAGVSAREMSTEESERLRSLGYVQASGGSVSEDLPDPKAMMRAGRLIKTAHQFKRNGQLGEAIRAAEDAVRECPGYIDGSSLLADLYAEANRPEDAIRVLEETLALNPTCGQALQLARTCMLLERWEEMERALERATELDPRNGFIHVLRADRYSLQNRLPEALAEYERALEIDEHRVGMLIRPHIDALKLRIDQRR